MPLLKRAAKDGRFWNHIVARIFEAPKAHRLRRSGMIASEKQCGHGCPLLVLHTFWNCSFPDLQMTAIKDDRRNQPRPWLAAFGVAQISKRQMIETGQSSGDHG